MSFYVKACFVIAGIALILVPVSWFLITKQLERSVEMQFEVVSAETFFSSIDRRTMGTVKLTGRHPVRGGTVETTAQVEEDAVADYTPGDTVTGRFIETEKEHYAHIGPAAEVKPFGPTPMFLGIAAVFGLLGLFLLKRGGGA